MMPETYESGNRRAEIAGEIVSFSRLTGKIRRSTQVVWKCQTSDLKLARRLAKGWAFRGRLGKAVV